MRLEAQTPCGLSEVRAGGAGVLLAGGIGEAAVEASLELVGVVGVADGGVLVGVGRFEVGDLLELVNVAELVQQRLWRPPHYADSAVRTGPGAKFETAEIGIITSARCLICSRRFRVVLVGGSSRLGGTGPGRELSRR